MRNFKQVLFGIGCYAVLNVAAYAAESWPAVEAKLKKADVPAAQSERVIAQAKQVGADAATVGAWADRIVSARAQQLPAELLTERMMQGLVKGVPAGRIERALDDLQNNLAWCKQALEAHVAKAELRARPQQAVQAMRQLEGGLRAGLSTTHWEQILGKTVLTLDQLRAVAETSTDLRTLGAPVEQVVVTMHEAAKGGADARELDKLSREFSGGVAKGGAAAELMQEFRRDLQAELRQNVRGSEFAPQRPDMPSGGDMRGPDMQPGGGDRPGGY